MLYVIVIVDNRFVNAMFVYISGGQSVNVLSLYIY